MDDFTGVELIAMERIRQIKDEGWTPDHDDEHSMAQMSLAALCYVIIAASLVRLGRLCVIERVPEEWPWDRKWWKPTRDPVRNLVKAGALIAAEIDRLRRRSAVAAPRA